jgi:glycosyltransferase involved in cell wall biosynthesis
MKNILVGYVLDGKHSGIDKYLLGVCRVAHEEKVRLDFLTEEITPWIKEYLEDLGFGLYEVPSLKNPIGQYKAIKKIIKDNDYDGVYANISESFNCMLLLAAKTSGIPCRMVHSHSSGVDRASRLTRTLRTALHKLFVPVVNRISTRRYACSAVAGEWMFGRKDYKIIYNAVDKSRFAFNLASRLNTRNELGLRDEHVLIHVGNFCYTKNQRFLMEIMQKITEKDENTVLLSVGTGYDADAVCEYARSLGINDKVRFLGVRDDVPALLCAADAYVFPSRFEGLSISCIEAQMSGLPCILSDTLSRDTQITPSVKFLPLNRAEEWADAVINSFGERKSAELFKDAVHNYDIAYQKKQLSEILKG